MECKIYVPAEDTWTYFINNKSRFINENCMLEIATCGDIAVYITEEKNFPYFLVYRNEVQEYTEGAINATDCTRTAQRCYEKYIHTDEQQGIEEDETLDLAKDEVRDMLLEIISDRESELCLAMSNFINAILHENADLELTNDDPEIIQRILDSTLECISSEGVEIYRPMLIEDEELGGELFTEYPYDPDAIYSNIEDLL